MCVLNYVNRMLLWAGVLYARIAGSSNHTHIETKIHNALSVYCTQHRL